MGEQFNNLSPDGQVQMIYIILSKKETRFHAMIKAMLEHFIETKVFKDMWKEVKAGLQDDYQSVTRFKGRRKHDWTGKK